MKHNLLRSLVAVSVLACLMVIAEPGHAINIVLVWDDLDENPRFDANGTQLMAVANAAAQIWEQLIPSTGTHIVDVSWSDLDDNQLGYWKFDPFGNNNLYFNKDSGWFIDPTPLVNEEYDFGTPFNFSTGSGSFLTSTTDGVGDWFDGPPLPRTLEIGYVGLPTATAPTAAIEDFDLLSVVLHELGHELGVAGDELSGRYPIYPQHISGVMNLEVVEGNFDGDPDDEGFGEEHGHIAPPMALMSPSTGSGKRTLPSATDVLVAARDSNYLSVDLRRKFAGSGTNWNAASTWIGGRVPDASDDVYMIDDETITLSGTGRAENLYMNRGATLATGAHSLSVDNLLAVGTSGGTLRIHSGGSASIGTLQAPDFSTIEMLGGTLNVVNGGSIGGELIGRGTVDFDGLVLITGIVEATGGTLTMTGNGSIKLLELDDPWPTGEMLASEANLKLGLNFAAGSHGSIRVDAGRQLVITRDVTIPFLVDVDLNGTDAQPALITSEGPDTDVTISNLEVGGNAQILARTVTLDNYALIGGHLTLASPVRTTLQGGLSMYSGTVKQDGDISVTAGAVNLAVAFDWGNSTPTQSNELRLHPNATLEISSVVGAFRGDLTVDSAILQVDTPGGWELGSETAIAAGGRLVMIQSGAVTPIVRGTPITARSWILTSGGDAFIESDLTVMPTAEVIVLGGSKLFLMGHTTLRGGSITGLGDLVQRGDIDVTDDTTIDTERFAWGNSLGFNVNTLIVHPGKTLTVNSATTDDTNNQFRGAVRVDGGTLVVNTDSGWLLPEQQLFQIGGALELDGTVLAPRVQGQPLAVGGRIFVTGGHAHFDSEVGFQSTQQTDLAPGATLHVNGTATYAGGTFTGAGTLQHNGTALLTSNPLIAPRFIQNGQLTVISPSNNAAIQAPVIDFQTASKTRVIWDLHLRGNAIMRPGAIFEGGGTLVVDPTGTFTGGGALGVDLENQGVVRPGFSPGTLTVSGDYTQSPLGTLHIELAGTGLGDWDILAANGSVSLDGLLHVVLLDGFVPALGDSFKIVTSRTALAGTFSAAMLPPVPGQSWAIDYSATSVTLFTTPGLPGDIDGDGDVDRTDAAKFSQFFGIEARSIWTTGDFNADGATTIADWGLLQTHLGQSVSPSPSTAAVPEPASFLLALSLIALACARAKSDKPNR